MKEKGHGNAHHQNPAVFLSFIGHTLAFWPQESLVYNTLDTNHIGVTLRVDLPKHDGRALSKSASAIQISTRP
ncbi:DUF4192 family protein [Arthrobacter sp. B2a2-09]|uniref:DUF4192 family protein n=1 Tax=Arthrobacter sp. B2a2-09 TaxID=2952822 RepID=UPI0022CDB196|nr:DUF4192 family protein [Arthrobacter sp. B2a2-09]